MGEMERTRAKLPAFNQRDELIDAIQRSQVLVVSGETGCGKTTQLPQFILEKELLQGGVLQSDSFGCGVLQSDLLVHSRST